MWEGPLHKKQKVVKGGSVYGPGPVRRTLTVPSENSAPPAVPLPLPGRLFMEEWNDGGGLFRENDAVREQRHILGRDFNSTEVFTFT